MGIPMTVIAPWRRFAALCLLLPALAIAESQEEEQDGPAEPETIEELKAAIGMVLEETETPSVGIAIVDETGPVWVDAIGIADIESETPATRDSMYRIGSTTKMFVALSVLQLVEEGRLSLDDKLADLAPEIEFTNQWEETDPVRVVHLLEHTTGWDDMHLVEYASNDPAPLTLKQGLDLHPHSRTSRWKPGSRSSYCNTGPPTAAYIVQKITGQDFEDYVRENFFEPMGMETMTYRLSDEYEELGVSLYANGEPQPYWHISVRPSGSINASPSDMAKFVEFFINRGVVNGEALVSAASLKRMETVGSTPAAAAGQQAGYALHNYSSYFEHWDFRTHNGGVIGGLTEMSYLPEAGRGYAFMINAGNGVAYEQISDLVRGYLTRDLDPPEPPESVDLGPQHAALAGHYRIINPRQEASRFSDYVFGIQRFFVDDGKLSRKGVMGGTKRSYRPITDDLFISDEYGMVAMSAVEDPLAGPVIHISTSVWQKVSPLIVYSQLIVAILWGLAIVISIPYLLVWGIRRWRGKVPGGATIRIRVWPLLAGLSVILFLVVFTVGSADPFNNLGAPTPVSITIMLSTIAFAVFAVYGLLTAWRERATPMNKVNYWYSTGSSVLHTLVALYLLIYGVIGMMTWT